jgi:stage V sporulation protein SpoVS
VICIPSFTEANIEGKERMGVRITVEPRCGVSDNDQQDKL